MRISASNLSRQVEHARREGYLALYRSAAQRTGLPVALLLAKDSRESCLGRCLDANFRGDNGQAWGLSQIDQRFHSGFTSSHSPRDHAAVIRYGAELLADEIAYFEGDTAAGLTAYNAGRDAVRSAQAAGLPVDTYTTGGDYASDVLDRAEAIGEQHPRLADVPGQSVPKSAAASLAALAVGGTAYLLAGRLSNR